MNFNQPADANEAPDAATPDAADQEDFESALGAAPASTQGKGSLLVLLGLLVVGASVVWFMYFRGTPPVAQAAMTAGDAGADIKQFLDAGNLTLMKQTMKDTEKVVQRFRSYPAQTQVPLASLHTNPFRELPPGAENSSAAKKTSEDETAEHAKIVNAVADLHVQSIVHGSNYRACMINNSLYIEGQHIGVFVVVRIKSDAVVLESGKYRFELKMQN